MVRILSKDERRETTRWRDGIAETTTVEGVTPLYESSGQTFAEAHLRDLHLLYSNLDNQNLVRADFSGSRLDCSSFRYADLTEAQFANSSLQCSDFTGARLTNANFFHADLLWANFSDCDLRDACFEGAHLEFASYNDHTIWPTDISPESVRAKKK